MNPLKALIVGLVVGLLTLLITSKVFLSFIIFGVVSSLTICVLEIWASIRKKVRK